MRSAHMAYIALLSFSALSLISPLAFANPLKSVGGTSVTKGRHAIEMRAGLSSDQASDSQDGRFNTRTYYDYGVSDWYAIRFGINQDNQGDGNYQHSALTLDNRFQVFERNQHGFDGGFRLSYSFRDGNKKPDTIEARWINVIPLQADYEFRHHVIVQHQIGQESRHGLMPELRWQVTRPFINDHRVGVEMFNEFGNIRYQDGYSKQNHSMGLVFTGPLWKDLNYQTGYRHSLSRNAPDHAVKFFIGHDF
jgi:hypothetical protein